MHTLKGSYKDLYCRFIRATGRNRVLITRFYVTIDVLSGEFVTQMKNCQSCRSWENTSAGPNECDPLLGVVLNSRQRQSR